MEDEEHVVDLLFETDQLGVHPFVGDVILDDPDAPSEEHSDCLFHHFSTLAQTDHFGQFIQSFPA